MRGINLHEETDRISDFIRLQLRKAGLENLVIGLSGGIDSSLAAALSVEAVGADKVFGVMLPYRTSHPDSLADAITVAHHLGIRYRVVDISPMVDAWFDNNEPEADPLRRGNRKARERMCVLFDLSAKHRALVVGTGNKSELMVGYVTQHGDGACAFEPIGHLYKTEVREMARLMGLPGVVIDKAPTADLWDGQTDEDEMGITYDRLDQILYRIVDQQHSHPEDFGFTADEVDRVRRMIARSEFKRHLPPVPE